MPERPTALFVGVLDHGERGRQAGTGWREELASLEGVEDAARYIAERLPLYRRWSRVPGVLLLRYEDLLADTVGQLRRLARHLGLAVPEPTLAEVAGRRRLRQETLILRRRAVREEQGGRRVRRDELGAGVEPPPLQQGGGGAVRRGAERGGAGRVRAALRPLPPPHGVRLLNGLLRRCAASTSPSLHSPPLTTGSGTTRPGWPAPPTTR